MMNTIANAKMIHDTAIQSSDDSRILIHAASEKASKTSSDVQTVHAHVFVFIP